MRACLHLLLDKNCGSLHARFIVTTRRVGQSPTRRSCTLPAAAAAAAAGAANPPNTELVSVRQSELATSRTPHMDPERARLHMWGYQNYCPFGIPLAGDLKKNTVSLTT